MASHFPSTRIPALGALLLHCLIALPAAAQEAPGAAEMTERIRAALPGFWGLSEYREIAAQPNNDPIAPELALRFEVSATSEAPLYIRKGDTVGPFAVLLEAAPAGSTRKLYGTAALVYTSGAWEGAPVIENPVEALGLPVDLFTEPTVILGSEAYDQAVAAVSDERIEAERVTLDSALAALKAEHLEALADMKAEQAAEIQAMDLQEQGETEALRAGYLDKRNQLIAAEEAALQQLHALPDAHWAEMEQLQAAHRAEVEALQRDHATKMGELTAGLEAEMTQAEMGFSARKKVLEAMAAEAAETLALQEQLIATRETVLDNEAWLGAMSSDLRARRHEVVGALIGAWSGQISCSAGGLDGASVGFTLDLAEFSGGNLAGAMALIGHRSSVQGPVPALAVLHGDVTQFPVRVTVDSGAEGYTDQGNLRLDFDLVLDEAGSLSGAVTGAQDCAVTLAR